MSKLYTADGVEIIDGLIVWDYNLDRGAVNLSRGWTEPNGDRWFHVNLFGGGHSLMNGERVRRRHPFTGEAA